MKKLANVIEVEDGLDALLGEVVTIWAVRYIYYGTLSGVNGDCIRLDNAFIVYETGAFGSKKFNDAQKLDGPRYIMKAAIESFEKSEVTL